MALLRRLWDRVPGAARIGVVAVVVAVGAAAGTAHAAGDAGHVRANALGELDCNGFSPIQASAKPTLVCADLRTSRTERFEDHGHYIGHDEPSLRFLSSRPGSASDVTWVERLPVEPHRLPTVRHPGRDVTHSFELTIAPWFSMNLCDPKSDPATALQAAVGHKRRPRLVPGRRLRVYGVAVLPAGVRAVRRLDQLRQHPLVLGAHHRQRRVRRGGQLQRQLHRAGQLRVHPEERRPGRAAEPAASRTWRRSRRTGRPC